SGVDATNPDLDGAGKVADAGDFSTPVDYPTDPYGALTIDDAACTPATCPHGTAVATAAAAEAGDGGMVGVAPDATIRSYSVFRRTLYSFEGETFQDMGASSFDVASALDAVATYASTHP